LDHLRCQGQAGAFPITAGPRQRTAIDASLRARPNPRAKADQKARGRYLGGKVPFGFRLGDDGELVAHEAEQEAIREIGRLRAQGKPLRAIAEAVRAKGVQISHEGVAGVLRSAPLAPSAPAPDALSLALAANPNCRVLPRSGKGFVIGGQKPPSS
jgi:hypothetical protein